MKLAIGGAQTQEIVNQVAQCPSGALSTVMNAEKPDTPEE